MTLYRFGSCELDTEQHRLRVAGIERHVEPQVFDLLHLLAEKGEAVTTRDELIERVWQGRIVSDSAISVRINAARKVVGDSGDRQSVIKTIARRGFRLVNDVTRVEDIASHNGLVSADVKPATISPKPTLGVFPFDTLSDDLPAYLVRGIAEDIATELSRFHSIDVVSPYSTFRHDFNKLDKLEIARSLGVSHVVTGSFNGDKSIQRINVCLLDTATANIVWSERYDVHGDDIFAARDDAVLQIVSALFHGLAEQQSDLARKRPVNNLSAYDCLLRGLHIYKWDVSSLEEAKQALFWFNRAIDLNPNYARAMAWRECCSSTFWSSPPTDLEIEQSARRMALVMLLDENDHEAHRLKGALHMCSGEFELGDYHLAKSVELNPNDAHILIKIGMYRSFLKEHTDDLTYVDTAFARNPLHPAWYWNDRGIALFAHQQYEQSINSFQRGILTNEVSRLYMASAHALLDRLDEAKLQITQLHAMNPDADIDWSKAAYPTRCFEDSESKNLFFEGLRRAGL